MTWDSLCAYVLALVVAPLLTGVINRVKAMFAGRHGQPLMQAYFDLAKLLRKGAVYSGTTTWVFRTGPVAGLAAVLVALAFVPLGKVPALVSFNGDFLLVAYLFGVMRFVTVMAALDTGSRFEGMGASREVQFSALAEPAWVMGLVTDYLDRLTAQGEYKIGIRKEYYGQTLQKAGNYRRTGSAKRGSYMLFLAIE